MIFSIVQSWLKFSRWSGFSILLLLTSCQSKDTLFTLLNSGDTGVKFNNYVEEDADNNVLKYGYFYNGGGVAAGDFNNDGRVDLYFTGNMVADKLYLNITEIDQKNGLSSSQEITFEDATEAAGIKHSGWKTGVSLVDINNDGWLDIYVCRSGAEDPNLRKNLLYVNQGTSPPSPLLDEETSPRPNGHPSPYKGEGKGVRFVEPAAQYGLDDDSYTTQAAFFDYDKDGDLDCFLLNHSVQAYAGFSNLIANHRQQTDSRYGSKLLRNDNGKFSDITTQSGLINNVLSFGLGLNVSDFNNDGWLDLYVTNDYNENDYLYLNQQNGTYKEVVREAMGHTSFYSMGTDAADVNNDGLTDIVTLDMQPEPNNRIKLTAGDDNYDKYQMLIKAGFHHQTMRNMLQINTSPRPLGTPLLFKEKGNANKNPSPYQGAGAGGEVKKNVNKNPSPYKGVGAGGEVKKNANKTPSPYQGEGAGGEVTFSEIGQLAGISNTDWSWSALFADFDNDGLKDLFITNGYARDYTNMEFLKYSTDKQLEGQNGRGTPTQMDVIEEMPAINEPNYIFKNKDGLTFEKKTQAWGFEKLSQSNGAVYADLDNDGDLDLVVNNINDKAFIYQNNNTNAGFLQVVFKAPNEALKIGAKVAVWANKKAQYQEFQPVRGFQSAMYGPLHFGLGTNQKIDSVVVDWADGKRSVLKNVKINQNTTADYRQIATGGPQITTSAAPLFLHNASYGTPQMLATNDFKMQPLLPEMRSYTSPCLAKGDANGDGREDVYVGGERGQAGSLFLQNANGFVRSSQPDFDKDAAFEDSKSSFFDADGDQDLDLMVVGSGYALNAQDPLLVPRLYLNQKGQFIRSSFTSSPLKINAAALAVADVDADGDQDVFVGANCVPGRYPEAQQSALLLNDGKGQFTPSPRFSFTGLVTGACFTNLNNDKRPDLLLVGEFMKPTVFINQNGKFVQNPTSTQSLNYLTAKSLQAADLDNDGDDDFVVGNAGQNHQFNITSDGKLKMYYGDFGDNGGVVPLLSVLKNGQEYPYASRDEILDQVPLLKKKYPDYISYSTATMGDILTDELRKKSQMLEADELRTGILWNDKGTLVFEPLPTEAQFAPVYAIAVADLNNDGKKDLVLGGNFTHARVRLGKCDANQGQVFLNQGQRKFSYLAQVESGLRVRGDVRSAAMVGAYLWFGINNQPVQTYSLKNR